jgi:hypothetical protein
MHNFWQRQRQAVAIGVCRQMDLDEAIARNDYTLINRVE